MAAEFSQKKLLLGYQKPNSFSEQTGEQQKESGCCVHSTVSVSHQLDLPPLSSAIWRSLGLIAWLASRSTEMRSLACLMLFGVKKV